MKWACYGRRHFGVPPGGPFDRESFLLATAWVGNPRSDVFEVSNGRIVVEVDRPVWVAWIPAGSKGRCQTLLPGRSYTFATDRQAYRGYLAWSVAKREWGELMVETPARHHQVCFVPGPQSELFDLDGWAIGPFTVTPSSNRIGTRLIGNERPHQIEIPSEPGEVGAIQVPPGGSAIIVGPDGPTIGGYPKIGVVIGASLDVVGRSMPGDQFNLYRVSILEARRLSEMRDRKLKERVSNATIALRDLRV